MKNLLYLYLFFTAHLALSQAKFSEAQIHNMNLQLRADPQAAIKAWAHPQFSLISGSGLKMDYKGLVGYFTNYEETNRAMSDLAINQVGETAIVTGKLHQELQPKGKPEQNRSFDGLFTYTYVYEDGRWQLLAAHHSALPTNK